MTLQMLAQWELDVTLNVLESKIAQGKSCYNQVNEKLTARENSIKLVLHRLFHHLFWTVVHAP